MKAYFVKIRTSDSVEEICFHNYTKARQFAESITEGRVSIVENEYFTSELISSN